MAIGPNSRNDLADVPLDSRVMSGRYRILRRLKSAD